MQKKLRMYLYVFFSFSIAVMFLSDTISFAEDDPIYDKCINQTDAPALVLSDGG